jgi:hypothetical protein
MPLPRRERRHEGMSELGQTEKNSVRAYVFRFALTSNSDMARCSRHVSNVPNSGHHQVRASMQGKPKLGRRSNWNKIGKHGHGYEPTPPEPSTRGVVDIT